eukprot:1981867-Pyramimonas_sp.AAC.1
MESKPVDLKQWGSAAHRAIHQLDRLRPSQQCDQAGVIHGDLSKLVAEATRLSPENAVQALVRVAGVLSHATDTGE